MEMERNPTDMEQQTPLEFVRRRWRYWLRLNASWSSNWWYATVHNITAIIGSGVLSLPSAMAFLGWELGTFSLLGFIIFSQVCYWQIIGMHEMVEGRRFDRYHELGQYVLGKKLGFWLVVPLQMTVEVGVDTVYILTGASSLQKIAELICGDCADFRLSYWMMIFVTVQLLLSQLPHFPSITWVSVVAAVTAIGYSTLGWIAILLQSTSKPPPGLENQLKNGTRPGHDFPDVSAANITRGIFTALGKMAYATAAGHNIALEIQATIPSTPQRPSKIAMWNGVFVAYLVIAACYLPVALAGYWLYGNQVPKSCLNNKLNDCHVLLFLQKPNWMIILANIMIVLHMCGSYQVYAMPLFNMVETYVENKYNIYRTFSLRLLWRSTYVGFTLFLAATFPFFGDLEAFLGGFAIIPTTYLIPGVLWQLAKRPRRLSLAWLANMACILFSGLLSVALTAGGMWNLIENAKTYKFYQ